MSLFAALRPSTPALAHLELAVGAVLEPLEPAGGPRTVRRVPPDLWHVTVSFFGDVPDGTVPDLAQALAPVAARTAPLELRLRGAGVFDGRVLWAGVGGEDARLAGLSAALADAAGEVGVRVDRRPRHRAHLTLARAGAGARAAARRAARRGPARGDRPPARDVLAGAAAALAVYSGPTWCVTGVDLVESRAADGGRRVHEVVDRLLLGGVSR